MDKVTTLIGKITSPSKLCNETWVEIEDRKEPKVNKNDISHYSHANMVEPHQDNNEFDQKWKLKIKVNGLDWTI